VSRSTPAIGPAHLGQRHQGWVVGAIEGSDWACGGTAWRAAKHSGKRVARQHGQGSRSDGCGRSAWGASEVGSDGETHRGRRSTQSADCAQWTGNVGPVNYFLRALLHALVEERHFALVDSLRFPYGIEEMAGSD